MKKKYEIINPSDKCFIYGDIEKEREALFVAVVILGNGSYALSDTETGEQVLGFFMFGGINEFWDVEFGRSLGDALEDVDVLLQAAGIFESFEYGGERTSMNDIGLRAGGNAKNFREFLTEKAAKC